MRCRRNDVFPGLPPQHKSQLKESNRKEKDMKMAAMKMATKGAGEII